MVNAFDFATAGRILFGAGRVKELGAATLEYGRQALVVTGSNPNRAAAALESLRSNGIQIETFSITGEPTIQSVLAGAAHARAIRAEVIVALGGGAAIDAGKAIAALATNPGDVLDYLEVIGKAQPLRAPPLPCLAVPTTAGTGAEVTRNAVLTAPEHRLKVSLRHARMLPRIAIVDPELTFGLPPAVTASTGMDALTQLIEPFVSRRANPITDALVREGIPRVARSLRRAYAQGSNADARGDMALASLFGGMALANAGLGAVHGFAAPIGGMFQASHGAVCAALLAEVMEANLAESVGPEGTETVRRYEEVAQMVTGTKTATAADGVQWVRELSRDLRIPGLNAFGIAATDLPEIAAQAARASSMKANPISFTPSQLVEILERAL